MSLGVGGGTETGSGELCECHSFHAMLLKIYSFSDHLHLYVIGHAYQVVYNGFYWQSYGKNDPLQATEYVWKVT